MKLSTLVCFCCIVGIHCQNDPEVSKCNSPRIIIIGAGASGIAAASRLFQNGITNVTILEAENRIGGRVFSVPFGEYMIDKGGQWVHGEKDNAAFELAWPLGLLERSSTIASTNTNPAWVQLFTSSGSNLPSTVSQNIFDVFLKASDDAENGKSREIKLKTGSLGEYIGTRLNDYFQSHPEINTDLYKPILEYFNLVQMSSDAADSWDDVPAFTEDPWTKAEGDQGITWKEGTYGTILDILMKKYPNPEEELPVVNNTLLGNKVTKITYNEGNTKVTTSDGHEYEADHVIFTPSLGVLKADYEKLFDPPLPEVKINSIKNIGFGHVGKIFLHYEDPWWPLENDLFFKGMLWSEADRKEVENDPIKKWMLGATYIFRVEYKPKLIGIWMSSNHSIDMERVPDELFRNQTIELINRFFGNAYNLTLPTDIQRSTWNTNDNFRGTYCYRNFQSDPTKASYKHLATPILRNDKPVLQFAGEATDKHWSTVHGAISSGWREADRLIALCPANKNTN